MKNVQFVQNFDAYKKGEYVAVDDQIACDAIANGYTVPSVQPVQQKPVVTEQAPAETA
jgi:hypothetical protein